LRFPDSEIVLISLQCRVQGEPAYFELAPTYTFESGSGANTSVMLMVDRVLRAPPKVEDPEPVEDLNTNTLDIVENGGDRQLRGRRRSKSTISNSSANSGRERSKSTRSASSKSKEPSATTSSPEKEAVKEKEKETETEKKKKKGQDTTHVNEQQGKEKEADKENGKEAEINAVQDDNDKDKKTEKDKDKEKTSAAAEPAPNEADSPGTKEEEDVIVSQDGAAHVDSGNEKKDGAVKDSPGGAGSVSSVEDSDDETCKPTELKSKKLSANYHDVLYEAKSNESQEMRDILIEVKDAEDQQDYARARVLRAKYQELKTFSLTVGEDVIKEQQEDAKEIEKRHEERYAQYISERNANRQLFHEECRAAWEEIHHRQKAETLKARTDPTGLAADCGFIVNRASQTKFEGEINRLKKLENQFVRGREYEQAEEMKERILHVMKEREKDVKVQQRKQAAIIFERLKQRHEIEVKALREKLDLRKEKLRIQETRDRESIFLKRNYESQNHINHFSKVLSMRNLLLEKLGQDNTNMDGGRVSPGFKLPFSEAVFRLQHKEPMQFGKDGNILLGHVVSPVPVHHGPHASRATTPSQSRLETGLYKPIDLPKARSRTVNDSDPRPKYDSLQRRATFSAALPPQSPQTPANSRRRIHRPKPSPSEPSVRHTESGDWVTITTSLSDIRLGYQSKKTPPSKKKSHRKEPLELAYSPLPS
jgi:hypothetical protein